ncbi:hypothetical protein D3C81_1814130 [compost metagenome]
MEMRLRLFYEDQVERWAVFLNVQPSTMNIEQFNNHINQVLETEAVVPIRQGCRDLCCSENAERVVNTCPFMATQNGRRVQCSLDQQPRIIDPGISQIGQTLQSGTEDTLQMVIQQTLGLV